MLPPKAGRVCRSSLVSGSISSAVQSAVRPVSSSVATAEARSRPLVVAPSRMTSGECFARQRRQRLAMGLGGERGQRRMIGQDRLPLRHGRRLLRPASAWPPSPRMTAAGRDPRSAASERATPSSSQETLAAASPSCSMTTQTSPGAAFRLPRRRRFFSGLRPASQPLTLPISRPCSVRRSMTFAAASAGGAVRRR